MDFAAGRLYAAQAGYGVYRARVPVVEEAIRALNAADLSRRPAAPGSLLTIRGMAADRAEAGNARAPILSRGRRETQLQVPFNQAGRSLGLTLWAGLRKFELSMPLARVSPAIFIEDGEPLILDAGSGAIVGRNRPARPGGAAADSGDGVGPGRSRLARRPCGAVRRAAEAGRRDRRIVERRCAQRDLGAACGRLRRNVRRRSRIAADRGRRRRRAANLRRRRGQQRGPTGHRAVAACAAESRKALGRNGRRPTLHSPPAAQRPRIYARPAPICRTEPRREWFRCGRRWSWRRRRRVRGA